MVWSPPPNPDMSEEEWARHMRAHAALFYSACALYLALFIFIVWAVIINA